MGGGGRDVFDGLEEFADSDSDVPRRNGTAFERFWVSVDKVKSEFKNKTTKKNKIK